jgi:hypothetical protein
VVVANHKRALLFTTKGKAQLWVVVGNRDRGVLAALVLVVDGGWVGGDKKGRHAVEEVRSRLR